MKSAKPWMWASGIVATLLITVLFVGPMVFNAVSDATRVTDVETESANTQVINAITRTQEVSLLSLGIQGIAEQSQQRTFLGVRVPGTERASFLQYSFNAKLGIDGGDVRIREAGENGIRISIPEFIFIGHDDVSLKLVTEKNGVLSFVTPEIDTVEMTNSLLNDEAKGEYIDANEDLLRDQAESFYEGIVEGIDPAIDVDFDYLSRR